MTKSLIDEASKQSFPSSDPSAFTLVMGVNRAVREHSSLRIEGGLIGVHRRS
jgi:hypothetical protein